MHIENRYIIRLLEPGRLTQRFQGLSAMADALALHAPGTHLMMQDCTVGNIIINDQYPYIPERFMHSQGRYPRRAAQTTTYGKPERRSLPRRALYANRAAHHGHQLFGNR